MFDAIGKLQELQAGLEAGKEHIGDEISAQQSAMDAIESANSNDITIERSDVGSRIARLDQVNGILDNLKTSTETNRAALQDTDRRLAEGKRVAPSFLLACVLWQDVREGWQRRLDAREHAFPALQDAIDEVFNQRIGDVSGRGKLAADMREIWVMQPRFEKRVGRIPESMVAQLRFRAGFDFMRLRADVGEVDEALADWWQKFSTADEDERYDLMEQAREEQKARSRQAQGTVHRVPPRTKAADPRGLALDEGADNHAPDADTAPPPEGSAPKKRRRRRRKPGGAAGGSAPAADA